MRPPFLHIFTAAAQPATNLVVVTSSLGVVEGGYVDVSNGFNAYDGISKSA